MNITKKQYAKAWYELAMGLNKKEFDNVSKKILNHLHKRGKISWISEIAREIEQIESEEKGILRATITSAKEIDQKNVEKICKDILKTKQIIISQKINPDIIGGLQIETKNKRWDLSIKNQLNQLSNLLN